MDYGKKIAELRKRAGLTQAELGTKLNVTSQAVSKWEKGISEPDLETINKMCELFNISHNEFFNEVSATLSDESVQNTAQSEVKQEPVVQTKIIEGYCERCHKPVGPTEYKVVTESVHSAGPVSGVRSIQHVYCNNCSKKINEEKIEKDRQRRKSETRYEIKEYNKKIKKSLIWGTLGAIVMLLILIACLKEELLPNWKKILIYVLGFYATYATISQAYWGEGVGYILMFFSRSLKFPGIIFSLDLDGIINLILIKILFGIIGAIFSFTCFMVGLGVSMVFSIFTFPFALAKIINKKSNLKKNLLKFA